MYPRSAGRLDWQDTEGKYSYDIYGAVKSFELPSAWIKQIKRYCDKKGIDFLASVFDPKGVKYLIKNGMKAIKISSYSLTNLPFIEYCASFRLPIIMSTGGATLGETEEAVNAVNKYHNKLSLLQCALKYPAALNECNLGIIETLRHAFPDNTIGYSDHTQEVSKTAIQAVYLGASIIEKHITLDRGMKGPDHFFALEPYQLKEMVKDIRKAEKRKGKIDKKIYGSPAKLVFRYESYLRDFCFTTLFAGRDIKKGERIRYQDLCVLRPGKKERGLEPKYLPLFKSNRILAAKHIKTEEPIKAEHIYNA